MFYFKPKKAAHITINYNNIEINYDHNKLGNITTKNVITKNKNILYTLNTLEGKNMF